MIAFYYNKANKFSSSYKDIKVITDLLYLSLNLYKQRLKETIRGTEKYQKKRLETTITIIGDLIITDIKTTSNAAINITSKVRNIFPKSITKSA